MEIGIFAALGFLFAAYAVVGNDSLQTLGTFINSNSKLHWFWLFLFAGSILVITFTVGWVINDGDPSWGRLANASKYPWPEGGIQWYHTLPPLALLIITRFGIPVSTTFMVLTVFASVGGMTSMLTKSLIGYGLAFVVGLVLYLILSRTIEKSFSKTEPGDGAPFGLATVMGLFIAATIYFVPPLLTGEAIYGMNAVISVIVFSILLEIAGIALVKTTGNKRIYWVILQWTTTAYLWGVWLIQDFANIFVFLPRELTAVQSFVAISAVLGLLAYTFWNKGGPVQKILQAKTAVTDIRSAAVINFIYASLLFLFKEVSNIPMSTTFVFLGLIAGREYGFTLFDKTLDALKTVRLTVSDACKAYIGLVVSLDMAVGLPRLAARLSGDPVVPISDSYIHFIIMANIILIPVALYLRNQDNKRMMVITGTSLTLAAAAFLIMPPS